MASITLPAGTAPSDDAQRQGVVSQFFYLLGDVMRGVDDQPVLDSSTRSTGVIGPSSTLGSIDIGVGANGDIFVRGRTSATASTGTSTAATKAASGFTITPLMLLGAVALGWFLLKR